jgi:hypothetical protein
MKKKPLSLDWHRGFFYEARLNSRTVSEVLA